MKKLILALTVMCLTGVVYANQQCFFGRNCVGGRIVKQERAHKKTWMKGPMMKKEGCPMMKEGKPCGCKDKMMKKKCHKEGKWDKKGKTCKKGEVPIK